MKTARLQKKLTTTDRKKVLVAPLNWGLGHATRCMPIINELLTQNVEVVIASDGTALDLLRKEFPQLPYLILPAYNVSYRTQNMVWNMTTQLPKILFAMLREWFALQRLIKKEHIDAVISDNRYGCWSWKVPTAIITHQINIKIPFRWLERLVNAFNHQMLQRFSIIWIPDVPYEPSLAGELSHGFSLAKAQFIGILSRMKPLEVEQRYDVGIILSGPEPQRTLLEKKFYQQITAFHKNIDDQYTFLFVKGKTDLEEYLQQDNLEIHGYLTANVLNQKMSACRLIITRSGYSTLMDLAVLGKKALLIPTPGQTEQEYLADYFYSNKIYDQQSQTDFDLQKAIKNSPNFKGLKMNEQCLLKNAVIDFLNISIQ